MIEKFLIKKENDDGTIKIEKKLTLEMFDLGGFDYGNKHGLAMNIEGEDERIFDVRYDQRFVNEKKFRKNAYEFVREWIRKDYEVIKV